MTTLAAETKTKQYTAYGTINLCISLPIEGTSIQDAQAIAEERLNELLIQSADLTLETVSGSIMKPKVWDWNSIQIEEIDEE